MLRIRDEQMAVFRAAALANFEDAMVRHSKEFSPRLCAVLGDDQVRVAVSRTLAKARSYGFTRKGPARFCVELMFLFGSAFDTDDQYPWAATILQRPEDQMQRARWLFEALLDYQEKVSGPGAENTRRALSAIAVLASKPKTIAPDSFVPALLQETARIFPEKASYIGEERLTALILAGREQARRFGLPDGRAEALLVILMFAFGHGCVDDALYPWIGKTLRDDKIINSTARAQRLEKKAVTWLGTVLDSFPKA